MSKLHYLLILAFMATYSVAIAQDRLAMSCRAGIGAFMPEATVENEDNKFDGTGWQLELGVGFMPTWGLTLGTSVVFGESDLDYDAAEDLNFESEVMSSALFFDVNYDFLNAIPGNYVSVIGGLGTGFAYNTMGAIKWVGVDGERAEGDAVICFAFRVSLIARVNVTEAFGIYAIYQYQDLGKAETGDTASWGGVMSATGVGDVDLTANIVGVGVEYKF